MTINNVDAALAHRVANKFSAYLLDVLGADQLREVNRRNAAENSPIVCHSHDFCDANMIMSAAMEYCGLTDTPETEEECAIWNAAWDIAKANGFQKTKQRRGT